MSFSIYETHNWENPLLPLIFHSNVVTWENATPNWHENMELLLCLEGEGYVKCDAEDHPFSPGRMVVVNSGAIHSVHSSTRAVYHCLIIGNGFCKENGIDATALRFREEVEDENTVALFRAVAQAIGEAKEHPYPYSEAVIRGHLLALLVDLCRRHTVGGTEEEKTASPTVERVKEAILYIKNHTAEQLTLDEIAAHAGISKYHLSREFKATTGQTVFEMVNLIRCKEARRMIADGTSVSGAAMACGFENLSYFSRCFKKHFGVLPSQCVKRKKSRG